MHTVEPPTGKLYEGHIPISPLQRTILAVGSAFTALANPLRGGNKDYLVPLNNKIKKRSLDSFH